MYYTISDLSRAKTVQAFPEIYKDRDRARSRRVIAWFADLYTLAREYHSTLNDWQLSIKCAWSNVRNTEHNITDLLLMARGMPKIELPDTSTEVCTYVNRLYSKPKGYDINGAIEEIRAKLNASCLTEITAKQHRTTYRNDSDLTMRVRTKWTRRARNARVTDYFQTKVRSMPVKTYDYVAI